ncbi:MAG: hypothetical protein AAGJ82_02225 [Bacteroidota bacterium]
MNRNKHIQRWKRWASYLMELHVESRTSDYNPHLHVSIQRGRLMLSTANAVYSYEDLYTNFARTFEQWNWVDFPPQNVLILGLGLGSITQLLTETHERKCHYTAVEIDEEVVDLAYQYILEDLDCPLELIVANAAIAVQQLTPNSYDLLCVDLFDDDTVPAVFETVDFLRNAQELLTTNGVLLFNRLAHTAADRAGSDAFFTEVFQRVFPEALKLDVGGNYMLVSRGSAVSGEW